MKIPLTHNSLRTHLMFLVVIIIFGFSWPIFLLTEWGSDFGVYYVTASFLGDDYQLYKSAFDHKGPVYYLFIKGIGNFIGWGAIQAFMTLGITVLFYLLTIFYVAKHYLKDKILITVVVGLSFATLFQQPSNVSIALFQSALLILFFHTNNLLQQNRKTIYLIISIFLLCMATLTRIDSVIYILLFIPLVIILGGRQKITIRKLVSGFSIGILSSFVFIWIIFSYFGFSLNDFYIHNVHFNNWYKLKNTLSMFYRPVQFKYFITTGLFPITLILLSILLNKIFFQDERMQNTSLFKNIITPERILSLSTLVLSILALIYSGSDKNYHAFILIPGILFFIISNLNLIEKDIIKIIPAFIVYLIIISAYTLIPAVSTLHKKENLFNPFDKYSDVKRYEITVEDMRSRTSAYIVGGRGWPYLFSGIKPATAINNWWLYFFPESYTTDGTLKDHNKLINQTNGYEFWIENSLINKEDTSPLFQEILDVSQLLSSDGYYTKFIIQK